MTTTLSLLGEEPGTALILRSTRQHPALLIQGDRLSIAAQVAADLVSDLESADQKDAAYSARELAETLSEWLLSYERMMNDARRELPYSKP